MKKIVLMSMAVVMMAACQNPLTRSGADGAILNSARMSSASGASSLNEIYSSGSWQDRYRGTGVFSNAAPNDVVSYKQGVAYTRSMIEVPINKVTFPGTHNSFSVPGFSYGIEQNQDLTVYEQLNRGMRYVEFDLLNIAGTIYNNHNWIHSVKAEDQFREVAVFAQNNPDVVVLIGLQIKSNASPSKIEESMENAGLADRIWNYSSSAARGYRIFNPTTLEEKYRSDYPSIKDMTLSGNNVFVLYPGRVPVDGAVIRGLSSTTYYAQWQSEYLLDFRQNGLRWNTGREDQSNDNAAHRFMNIGLNSDKNLAGDRHMAAKNNDGRRWYEVAKWYENNMGYNRAVNIFSADFVFGKDLSGEGTYERTLPITIVDAANKLNFERFGQNYLDFSGSKYFDPIEAFNEPKVNIVENDPALMSEVNWVVANAEGSAQIYTAYRTGDIRSDRLPFDRWNHDYVPEWAFDNDYHTRWCPDRNQSADITIKFSQPEPVDAIALTWEYHDRHPGYEVYVSNDGSNYTRVLDMPAERLSSSAQFKPFTLDAFNSEGTAYRYVKIHVNETANDMWASLWEVDLFKDAP